MRAYIGLGSNLDDPLAQLRRAHAALAQLDDSRVIAASPVYRNPAMPVPGQNRQQPDYLNAAVAIETALAPLALLAALQTIETAQGRSRDERWGARTLDLDLLLYGNAVVTLPQLTVPHPGLRERRFVLQPLNDIDPALALPDGTTVAALLARCAPTPLTLAGQLT